MEIPKVVRNAGRTYLAVSFLFVIVLAAGAIFNASASPGRIAFQVVMYILCSAPFFLGGRYPRHRLLALFMASYYLLFGMANLINIVFGIDPRFLLGTSQHLGGNGFSKADWIVILGGISFLSGYFLFSKAYGNRQSNVFRRDWNYGSLLGLALLFWVIGFTFSMAYDMVVTPMYIPSTVLGIPLGIASNFRLFSPLAGLMLIYLVTRGYRLRLVWFLLILIMVTEFFFGFLANSKEISFRLVALLLLGLYYLRGSIDRKIIFIALITSIPYMFLFNIYRLNIIEMRSETQIQALGAFSKNERTVLKHASTAKNAISSAMKAWAQRIDGKVYVDIIVHGTDSGQEPFLKGKSLMLFFDTFVPSFFWHDKPQASIGQIFNHAFHLSQSTYTFAPATQLGEFYWNFGTIGVVFGMLGIGLIFGYIASVLSIAKIVTWPRFMVLLVATYYLAIRFEVNIALQYSIFVRLVMLVAVMDTLMGFFGLRQKKYAVSTA